MLRDATSERHLSRLASNLNLKKCFVTDKEGASVPMSVSWESQVFRSNQ